MSEYQYVAFRAVDRPLTDAELRFAEKQSTRAEITRWSFTNEYHFGDFRGDVDRLLRSGYDVHLHYANFGLRRVALRLPGGKPFPERVWKTYTGGEGIDWKPDKKGKAGILDLQPFHDPDSIDEIWEPGEYVEDCVSLRQWLIRGDLRALYVLWLCTAGGDHGEREAVEPPVPLGLEDFVDVAEGILDFFGIDPLILVAASEGLPPLPDGHQADETTLIGTWVDALGEAAARRHLLELMTDDPVAVKAKLLTEFREQGERFEWPTVPGTRTFEDLRTGTETLRDQEEAKERAVEEKKARLAVQAAEREREKRIKKMVTAPEKWLAEAEKLVDARGTKNYQAAAEILADLRKAIGGDKGKALARNHAALLVQKYPTLTHLKSALRQHVLLD